MQVGSSLGGGEGSLDTSVPRIHSVSSVGTLSTSVSPERLHCGQTSPSTILLARVLGAVVPAGLPDTSSLFPLRAAPC